MTRSSSGSTSTTAPNMNELKGKQSALKGRLTNIKNQLDAHDDGSIPLTSPRYKYIKDKLMADLDKSEQLTEDIYAKADAAEQLAQQTESDSIAARILELADRLVLIGDPAANSTPQTGPDAGIRLPKLEIPSFSGLLHDWTSFHDLFVATVHNNAKLSKAHKLQYLKSSLKGDAGSLIQALQITDANYDEAWTLLSERYDNQREIIQSHLKRLFGQPCMKEESALALRRLIDTTNECLRALKVLNRPVDNWDDMVVFIVTERLDTESRRQWVLSLANDNPPIFKDLVKFLDQRARALTEAGVSSNSKPQPTTRTSWEKKPTMAVHHGAKQDNPCFVCQGSHSLFKCDKFGQLSRAERMILARRQSLCFNCLRGSHSAAQCTGGSCRKCKGKHHTLLHSDDSAQGKPENTGGEAPSVSVLFTGDAVVKNLVLLSTAILNITDSHGNPHKCRALLDSASEASFVTEDCVQRLGLPRMRSNTSIIGVGASQVGLVKSTAHLQISSCIPNQVTLDVDALVMRKVTKNLPSKRCNPSRWSHLKDIQLADPTFHEPGPIDVLLGADVFGELLADGRRLGKKGEPIAIQTILGWIVSGPVHVNPPRRVLVNHSHLDLESTLQRFWEVEEVPEESPHSLQEQLCEQQFQDTHSRNESGRFIVKLPFRHPTPVLGASRDAAVRRLKQVERRFSSCPELKSQYTQFMREYETLGHMQRIPPDKEGVPVESSYYLPHHAVRKDGASSTKFRVVFDGSAKTSSGSSLNEALMVGPKIQDDIFGILIRFRFHAVAICADISKMYRQILVHQEHWNFQRIVWREDSTHPVQDFWLKTVTYGTSSAPFQATRCTHQLAVEQKQTYPLASEMWTRDAFVDDLISGESTAAAAIEARDQLTAMMECGAFPLMKFSSNRPEVLESLPHHMREAQLPLNLDTDDSVKTLGLQWHPASDHFSFSVFLPSVQHRITKRHVLSDMSRIFDPLGWLSPVTVRAKILFQELWKLTTGWDEELPSSTLNRWLKYRDDIPAIKSLRFPRHVGMGENSIYRIHAFSDASILAYAGVVYLHCVDPSGRVSVNMLAAKTKVAPLKKTSVPRLELCGALLLARLVKLVLSSLTVQINEVRSWTDSTVVLDWLASSPDRWKIYVANRVAEIQKIIPSNQWHHVPGVENPADCASRGLSPTELAEHPLWWKGPSWLSMADVASPTTPMHSDEPALMEERKQKVTIMVVTESDPWLLTKYSSLIRLQRITAWCKRFVTNLGVKPEQRVKGPLTVAELTDALCIWVRRVQRETFVAEVRSLKKQQSLPPKSPILALSPFLDDIGLLRVGGRLQMAKLSMDKKHQLLIPKSHRLTSLIVRSEHLRLLHAGPQLLLASLHQRFWIPSGRDLVRRHVQQCITCVKIRAKTSTQMMGNLPTMRVTCNRPFLSTGVDFAGPFFLRVIQGRGHKQYKAHIALFVCLVTRAIHLELVTDLTSGAFIAALQRFVSRRGKSQDIFSDCGTNFVGANRDLKKDLQFTRKVEHNETVARYLSSEGISWHFNPPSAPHHGGLWEAGVKSVEACLNSRPLCPMSSDPSDLAALTPGHFLIGGPLTAIPEPNLIDLKSNHLSRWQLVQKLYQQFWKRWTSEFLTRLQQRPKWWSYRPNLQVGDLVLIKDDHLPPLSWPLGRVVETHPGKDNLVRVVTVKTAKSEFKRPIVKLCHLPLPLQAST